MECTEWVQNLHIKPGRASSGADEEGSAVWGRWVQMCIACTVQRHLGKVVRELVQKSRPLHSISHTQSTAHQIKASSSLQALHPLGSNCPVSVSFRFVLKSLQAPKARICWLETWGLWGERPSRMQTALTRMAAWGDGAEGEASSSRALKTRTGTGDTLQGPALQYAKAEWLDGELGKQVARVGVQTQI